MMSKFTYATVQDYEKASQWNQIKIKFVPNQEGVLHGIPDTSLIDISNPSHFIAEFQVNLIPEEPVNWLNRPYNEPISILLVHYDPLRHVWEKLEENSVICSDLEQFQDNNSILSEKYKKQIVSFQKEMEELGKNINQDLLDKANKADVIVCCYGEFMESPYREKHIFQGISRGKVRIYNDIPAYFQCQASHNYN